MSEHSASADPAARGTGDDVAPVERLFDREVSSPPSVEPDPTAAPAPADVPDALPEGAHASPTDPDVAGDEVDDVPDAPGDGSIEGQVDWERAATEDPRSPGEVLEELHAVAARRDEYLDSLQRKQAEFENFRRRMQGQAAQQRAAGQADVAGRMLEVLDDFDRTLASIATSSDDGVIRGVSLVRDKLVGALREVGLERVDDQGAHFDPTRHEAVLQVPGDGLVGDDGEPVVAEVLRPGYVLGDRVLRAAMVAVAQ